MLTQMVAYPLKSLNLYKNSKNMKTQAYRRDLCFIRTFRPRQGYDEVGNLNEEFPTGLAEVPRLSGVYIIASTGQRFVYPNHTSRIIYIGKTDDLYRRIHEHRQHLRNLNEDFANMMWCRDRYHYMNRFGARVYYYRCLQKQESKDLESMIMEAFYEYYLATPVGNGARSFRK